MREIRWWFEKMFVRYKSSKKYGWKFFFSAKYRRNIRNRKHKKKYGSGFLNKKKNHRKNLILRDGFNCKHCKKEFDETQLTIDHIIKISEGGSNEYSNLQLLCRPCHNIKDNN